MNNCKLLSIALTLLALILWPSLVFGQQTLEAPPYAETPAMQQEQKSDSDESDSEQQEDDAEEKKGEKSDSDQPQTQSLRDTPGPRVGTTRRRRGGFNTNSKQSKELIAAFEPIVSSTNGSVVRVMDGRRQIALGTIIDASGYVLTKLSELRGKLKCKLPDGSSLEPTVEGIDPDTDLALLKIDMPDSPHVQLNEYPIPSVGSWLATVDQESVPLRVGIVSHKARKILRTKLNSAVVGIYPEDIADGDGVRVNFVIGDSPAESAGILVNDVIIRIDEETIINRRELLDALSRYEPGDKIVLGIQRGEEELDFDLTLGKRSTNPMNDRGIRQNQLGSTLSKRRGDFPLAVQHDSPLKANQCGGPVVDLDGNIVGINIARDGRVSSLALPTEVVIPIVEKLRSGKFKPEVVNKQEIEQIQNRLTRLEEDMGRIPTEKTKKEIEFSAGEALEKELKLQVKEAEARLKKLQARLKKKKAANKIVSTALKDLKVKKLRIERRRKPLTLDLKQLKTGVR